LQGSAEKVKALRQKEIGLAWLRTAKRPALAAEVPPAGESSPQPLFTFCLCVLHTSLHDAKEGESTSGLQPTSKVAARSKGLQADKGCLSRSKEGLPGPNRGWEPGA
jgi:hypothetical protein